MVTHVCLWPIWLLSLTLIFGHPGYQHYQCFYCHRYYRGYLVTKVTMFRLVGTVTRTRQKCLILREFPILPDNNKSISPYYKIYVTLNREWQKLKQASEFHCKLPITIFTKIQIKQPTRCNSVTSFLLDVYVSLNMFRAPPRPSSGAYHCLWFYLRAWW